MVDNRYGRVSSFDMLKIGCVLERRVVPVQVPQPFVDGGVAMADVLLIALE